MINLRHLRLRLVDRLIFRRILNTVFIDKVILIRIYTLIAIVRVQLLPDKHDHSRLQTTLTQNRATITAICRDTRELHGQIIETTAIERHQMLIEFMNVRNDLTLDKRLLNLFRRLIHPIHARNLKTRLQQIATCENLICNLTTFA